jgi:hypothetical protein
MPLFLRYFFILSFKEKASCAETLYFSWPVFGGKVSLIFGMGRSGQDLDCSFFENFVLSSMSGDLPEPAFLNSCLSVLLLFLMFCLVCLFFVIISLSFILA